MARRKRCVFQEKGKKDRKRAQMYNIIKKFYVVSQKATLMRVTTTRIKFLQYSQEILKSSVYIFL